MVTVLHDVDEVPKVVDVVVVGGGPVGLSIAYLLGRQGISTVLLEANNSTTRHKAPYIHAPTAELYRQWGVLDKFESKGWPLGWTAKVSLADKLIDGEVAAMYRASNESGLRSHYREHLSPEATLWVSGAIYEPYLSDLAASVAVVRYGARVTGIRPGETQTAVDFEASSTPRLEGSVSARYVIAADGPRSIIRKQLGLRRHRGINPDQRWVSYAFKGDLEKYFADPRFWLIFTFAKGAEGYFARRPDSTSEEPGAWVYAYQPVEGEEISDERVRRRVLSAIGDPDFQFDEGAGGLSEDGQTAAGPSVNATGSTPLDGAKTLTEHYIRPRLTEKWRAGNVFLAGDSAHTHSPFGGFGHNLGVQDALNLAWKIGAVLRGEADDELLDSYEAERKPQALKVVKATAFNDLDIALLYRQVADLRELDDDNTVGRDLMALFGPRYAAGYFSHEGLQFGDIYRSTAMVPGATATRSEIGRYIRSPVPGARAPHVWLTDRSGREVSSRWLFGERFVLLEEGTLSGWSDAARTLADPPIDAYSIGTSGELRDAGTAWRDQYEVERGGAVLIRPDGFIAAKLPAASSRELARSLLKSTLDKVLRASPPA